MQMQGVIPLTRLYVQNVINAELDTARGCAVKSLLLLEKISSLLAVCQASNQLCKTRK